MILYNCAFPLYLGFILTHRLTINSNKPAIIMVDERHFSHFNVNKLITENIFQNIIPVDGHVGKKKKNESQAAIEQLIVDDYDKALKNFDLSLDDFEAVYTTNDWWYEEFNVYLSLKEISFFWLEIFMDMAHHLTVGWSGKKFQNVSQNYAEVMKKHFPLSPNNIFATPVLLEGSNKSKRLYKSKIYDLWDPENLTRKLNCDKVESIVKIFGTPKISSDSVLLLRVNDAWPSRANPAEENGYVPFGLYIELRDPFLKNIYTDLLALDWFIPLESKIYIKPHPQRQLTHDDIKKYWGRNAVNLGDCPFQILSTYLRANNIKFKSILGYGSTSNRSSFDLSNEYIFLSAKYWRSYYQYNRLYISLILAQQMEANILRIRTSEKIFEQVIFMNKILFQLGIEIDKFDASAVVQNKTMLIIDDMSVENSSAWKETLIKIPNNSVVAILDAQEKFNFYSTELREFLIPIKIGKIQISDNSLDPCVTETLWIFSKDIKIRDIARNITIERLLPRLGVKISVRKQPVSYIIEMFNMAERAESLRKLANISARHELIKVETNFIKYLKLLQKIMKKSLIIIAIKDTPTNKIIQNQIQQIKELGLNNFGNELRRTYIGVIRSGQVILDKLGNKEEPLNYEIGNWEGSETLKIICKFTRAGSVAQIFIDGEDYAINKRGINIVVYDIWAKTVIDSVSFDMHEAITQCFR